MKYILILGALSLSFSTAMAQWNPVGGAKRTDDNPIISGDEPFFLFENEPSTGQSGGVAWGIFGAGQGAPGDDFNGEAEFYYNRAFAEWTFSEIAAEKSLSISANSEAPDSYGEGTLRVGDSENGSHLGLDFRDIQAWDSDGSDGFLYLNQYGGDIDIGSLRYDDATDWVGIGTLSPKNLLDVDGSGIVEDSLAIGHENIAFTLDVIGNGHVSGILCASSDLRLKKDICRIPDAEKILAALRPVCYHFRVEDYPELALSEGLRYGLLAQEVEDVLPELVTTHKFKSVNYIDLIPILLRASQEQAKKVEKMEEADTRSRQRYTSLAHRLQNLEQAAGAISTDTK